MHEVIMDSTARNLEIDPIESDILIAVEGTQRLNFPKERFDAYKETYFRLYRARTGTLTKAEALRWEMVGTLAGFSII